MYSQYTNNGQEPELKDIISNVIQNKNQLIKQHSDCLNCLINCAQYRFTLQVIQESKKGKNNLFFVLEGENISSPLFFYKMPSNDIIQLIENKNIYENFLNYSQKIQSENDIIDNYEQNKKNRLLLFNYLKFPLININSENNINKESTIIILDDGKYDEISNHSIKSFSTIDKNYSLMFDIHNLKNANYLFSINDIKDCKEIKFKFNGNIHGKQLFKNDAICSLSPELIINSIKKRMEIYINSTYNEIRKYLYNKHFFTRLNDDNRNNIGLLFSFNRKKDINKIQFNGEYIMKENYIINKIFICVDMWINTNTIHETKDTSKSNSKYTNSKQEYYEEENNNVNTINNNNINYNSNCYDNKNNKNDNYNSNYTMNYTTKDNNDYNNFDNNNEYNNNDTEYINNYNNYNNYNNNYYNNNNYNNNYYDNTNSYGDCDNNYINIINNNYKTSNKISNKSLYFNSENKNKFNQNYSLPDINKYDKFWNHSKSVVDMQYSPYESYPSIQNEFDNINNSNIDLSPQNNNISKSNYENMEYLENCTIEEYYELNTLLNNIKDIDTKTPYIINNVLKEDSVNDIKNENKNESTNKSLFIDTNKEFIKEIFSKYKQNNCISNFSILKKRIDINMNIENEKLKKIKLKYFFDCFKDINNLSLNIPYITEKGKLLINEFNPTLSSMRLVLKVRKKIAKEINKQKKENFDIKIKQNLLKIVYEENKPPHERDLLYNKIEEIKEILGDNKLTFKNVLYEKSYFCILWSITNSYMINSSFLAYYSFNFKLIGICIIKLNWKQWLSSFSYDINNFNDYKEEYNKNIENIKEYFKNLAIDKEDGYYKNFYTHDYIQYIHTNAK